LISYERDDKLTLETIHTAMKARRQYVAQPIDEVRTAQGQATCSDANTVSRHDAQQDENASRTVKPRPTWKEKGKNRKTTKPLSELRNERTVNEWSAKSHLEKIGDGWDNEGVIEMERRLDKVWEISGSGTHARQNNE
jgi:hypothetical protein